VIGRRVARFSPLAVPSPPEPPGAPRVAQQPELGHRRGGRGTRIPMLLGLGVVVKQVVERAAHEDEVGYARAVEVQHDRPVDEHGHLRPVCASELYEAREAPAREQHTRRASCGAHLAVGRSAQFLQQAVLAHGSTAHAFGPPGRAATAGASAHFSTSFGGRVRTRVEEQSQREVRERPVDHE